MSNLFFHKTDSTATEMQQIKLQFLRELLRQYRYRSYLSLAIATVSAAIALFGIVNKIPEATLAAGGSTLASLRIVRDTEEMEEELRQYLER